MSQGRREDAHASLKKLFPSVAEQTIAAELDSIQENLDASLSPSSRETGVLTLFWRNGRSFLLGIWINILQQLTGINVIIYFGPTILRLAGFGKFTALLLTLGISIAQFVTVVANVTIVDGLGRRPVAIAGILVIMVGLALVAIGFFLRRDFHVWPPWVIVAGMFLFRAAFSFSLSPLPYIMTSELFPQDAKSLGVAVTWFSSWAANFVACQIFPVLEIHFASALNGDEDLAATIIFTLYVLCTGLALIFVIIFLPEGRGDRLEAIKD